MKIGILQTGHVAESLIPEHGDYDAIFPNFLAGRGLEFENFAVVDGIFPSDPSAKEGWLITGSRHGAYEGHDWIPPLEDFIRAAHATKAPMVGICFGHQIIAQALGGRVVKHDRGWIIGVEGYALDGLGPVSLNAWHQDQIVDLPQGARVVGQGEGCAYPALAYGAHIYTLQPHPEITPAYMRDLINVRGRGIVPEALLADAEARQGTALDAARLADHIAEFYLSQRG